MNCSKKRKHASVRGSRKSHVALGVVGKKGIVVDLC
jgi:hypothetical protein